MDGAMLMTPYSAGYRAGLEAAAGVINEYRLDDPFAELKDILAAIRALPVPEEAVPTEAQVERAAKAMWRAESRYSWYCEPPDLTDSAWLARLREMRESRRPKQFRVHALLEMARAALIAAWGGGEEA